MLVQGVIDLLIVYPDGTAAIVDYKTTEFSRLDSAAYRTQLELYAAAAERAGGLRVTHTYLYSFGHGLLEFPRADGGE
jgi:ATP-dependent exoDNAse (exonuclease V) beta subunit